jgi:hypothetical protein
MLPPDGDIPHAFIYLCLWDLEKIIKNTYPDLYLLTKSLCIFFPVGDSRSHFSAKMSDNH